ncbi:MAG TPA: ion transporter [Nitrospirales bacterium]|nr:ion transporter [Nitrospirales bacterium]HIC04587.1 ion transporter [Nitrospirales bacterium]HIN33816.1 ion transporter [Nitrospirales bacterium]
MWQSLVTLSLRITTSPVFTIFIVVVILTNAVIIGMETYSSMLARYGTLLHLADRIILGIFVVEIVLKIIACGRRPQDFFRDGWNVFDFIIVAAAFVPGIENQTTILRLVRLLRILRLLSALPSMQVMVVAMIHSIPAIGQMALLASLLFYVYAVIGQTWFGTHDPQYWGSVHIALLSLFRVLTLEDWTDLMYTTMEAYPYSWIFFVSFVLFATFIIFNMLIGVILNSMDEARKTIREEHARTQMPDLLDSVQAMRTALDDMERHIHPTNTSLKPNKQNNT